MRGGEDARRRRCEEARGHGVQHATRNSQPAIRNLLPWSHVIAQVTPARNYWINTASPDGVPHARPVWGVWVNDTFFCGGGNETRWQRNLVKNPRAVAKQPVIAQRVLRC
jgi:hypothetical protein